MQGQGSAETKAWGEILANVWSMTGIKFGLFLLQKLQPRTKLSPVSLNYHKSLFQRHRTWLEGLTLRQTFIKGDRGFLGRCPLRRWRVLSRSGQSTFLVCERSQWFRSMSRSGLVSKEFFDFRWKTRGGSDTSQTKRPESQSYNVFSSTTIIQRKADRNSPRGWVTNNRLKNGVVCVTTEHRQLCSSEELLQF